MNHRTAVKTLTLNLIGLAIVALALVAGMLLAKTINPVTPAHAETPDRSACSLLCAPTSGSGGNIGGAFTGSGTGSVGNVPGHGGSGGSGGTVR